MDVRIMSIIYLLTTLLNNMGLIIVLAIILSRLTIFKRLVTKQNITFKEKILLVIIFGVFGILGTYFGVRVKGAIANSRVIGVLVGGLLGGPVVGLGAGFIAGFHRWAFDIGGFTAVACAISTFVEGGIGGFAHKYVKDHKHMWPFALMLGIFAELTQMLIILVVAKPFTEALALVKIIILPMVTVNSLGIALFIAVVENIFTEASKIKAAQAQLALSIADKTLPYFRKGLTYKNARAVVDIIYNMTDLAAVAITDLKQIIAHVGLGEDHHLSGHEIRTVLTKEVIRTGVHKVVQNKKLIGCSYQKCVLGSAVIVPLKENEKVIGTLKLYKTGENSISSVEEELALGMARLFSTQLELGKIDRQAQLLADAELKVLQTQVNPHFLFNAINTIMSFCRTDPEKARVLLRYLGDYYRRNLHDKDFIQLSEEINHIKAYLAIEEARFSDKIQVIINIEPDIYDFPVPSLILQPIVENSIKHGLLPKQEGGKIIINGKKNGEEIKITISDNGVGFDTSQLANLLDDDKYQSIGLKNVNSRLINIYGSDYALSIDSSKGQGTVVEIRIPLRRTDDENKSHCC
jgi:two-component system sensor histidine kinase LytS